MPIPLRLRKLANIVILTLPDLPEALLLQSANASSTSPGT